MLKKELAAYRKVRRLLKRKNRTTSSTQLERAQKLYVMRNEFGLYKVGISKNVERRRRQLQNTSGLRVKIVKVLPTGKKTARVVEQSMHKLLTSERRRGEWFDCSLDDIKQAHGVVMGTATRRWSYINVIGWCGLLLALCWLAFSK